LQNGSKQSWTVRLEISGHGPVDSPIVILSLPGFNYVSPAGINLRVFLAAIGVESHKIYL